jgi:hypothetical protein
LSIVDIALPESDTKIKKGIKIEKGNTFVVFLRRLIEGSRVSVGWILSDYYLHYLEMTLKICYSR